MMNQFEGKIPVVILNYNDYKNTERFINHCLNDVALADRLTLILVDNASTDDSGRKLCEKFKGSCIFLQTPKNLGYAGGNNYGIRYIYEHLNAEYCLLCNPDTLFDSFFLARLLEIVGQHKDIKILGARALDPEGREQIYAWHLPGYATETFSSLLLISRIFKIGKRLYSPEEREKELLKVEVVQGSLMLIELKSFQKVGMFDTATFMYGEEQILAFKMKAAGLGIYTANSLSYVHAHDYRKKVTAQHGIWKYKRHQESKKIYLSNYCRCSRLQLIFFEVISWLGLLERKIVFKLR